MISAENSSWEKTLLLTRLALERKAYDLVVLDVRGLTSIADYFILCSGRSDRQVQSITGSKTRPVALDVLLC